MTSISIINNITSKTFKALTAVKSVTIIVAIVAVTVAAASCSDSAIPLSPSDPDDTTTIHPIAFTTYVAGKYANTRAQSGSISDITTLRSAGFGVFAYNNYNKDYTSRLLPNFMYNERIAWTSGSGQDGDDEQYTGTTGSWTYNPVKYWPNETNNKLSFFAYAPFQSIPTTQAGESPFGREFLSTGEKNGIVAISASSHYGDPLIGYQVATDSAQAAVDLLWGTQTSDSMPIKNISRRSNGDVVRFRFKHALSRLGINVRSVMPGLTVPINPKNGTIMLIKSINITGNFPVAATLNLNDTTGTEPRWQNPRYVLGDTATTIVIDDRSITRSLRDVDYKDIIANNDTALWNHNCRMGGVNTTSRYLLKSLHGETETTGISDRAYFMFIPNNSFNRELTYTPITITVNYTVQTIDSSLVLTGGYSRQEHTVTTTGYINSALVPGRTYTLRIVLTLQGMSFTVESEPWRDPDYIYYDPSVEKWKEQTDTVDVK